MELKGLKDNISKDKNYNYKSAIKTKKFIGVVDKLSYIDDVVDSAIKTDDNGISKVDFMWKEIMSDLLMIKYYTSLKLDDEDTVIEQYDFLLSKGIIDCVKGRLEKNSDYGSVQSIINKTLEQEISTLNSIEGLVANGIYNLIDKIPSEEKMMEIIKSFEGFDINKLGKLKELFDFSTKGKEKK